MTFSPDYRIGTVWWEPDASSASWTAGDGLAPDPQQFVHPIDASRGHTIPGHHTQGHPPVADSVRLDELADEPFVFDQELTQLLSEAARKHDRQRYRPSGPAATGPTAPSRHRRQHPVRHVVRHLGRPSIVSLLLVLLSAVLTLAVSAICGAVSYRPLQQLASPSTGGLSKWWPVLVYGPWLVGVLSLLRVPASRRLYHRAAWGVVIAFSGVAAALCLAGAPRTFTGVATQTVPPAAAVVCVALLSPQLGRSRPRHALSRQRG